MNNWPKEIPIPDTIGRNDFYRNNQPCCAVGHLHALGVWSDKRQRPKDLPVEFEGQLYRSVYDKLYRVLAPGRHVSTYMFLTMTA